MNKSLILLMSVIFAIVGCGEDNNKETDNKAIETNDIVYGRQIDFSKLKVSEIQAKGEAVSITCLGKEASFDHELYFENENRRICNSQETNTTVNLGIFNESEVLTFRLDVTNTGDSFYTGNASMNPDNIVHAKSYINKVGKIYLGFEDLYNGGDMDFNDCLFLVEGVKLADIEN